MSNVLKVEGHEGLVRDASTSAIINTNEAEYAAHISRKKQLEARKTEAKKQQEELANVKNELLELKNMVAELLSKGK
jgi:hypothetical protein